MQSNYIINILFNIRAYENQSQDSIQERFHCILTYFTDNICMIQRTLYSRQVTQSYLVFFNLKKDFFKTEIHSFSLEVIISCDSTIYELVMNYVTVICMIYITICDILIYQRMPTISEPCFVKSFKIYTLHIAAFNSFKKYNCKTNQNQYKIWESANS